MKQRGAKRLPLLAPAGSSFFRPGSRATLQALGGPAARAEGSSSPTWRNKKPVNASLVDSTAAAGKPKPGGAEKPGARASRPDQVLGPRAGAAPPLPRRAAARTQAGPEAGWAALQDHPYALQPRDQIGTRHRHPGLRHAQAWGWAGSTPAAFRPRPDAPVCAGHCGPHRRRSPGSGPANSALSRRVSTPQLQSHAL